MVDDPSGAVGERHGSFTWRVAGLWAALLLGLVTCLLLVQVLVVDRHRLPPRPAGEVLVIPLRSAPTNSVLGVRTWLRVRPSTEPGALRVELQNAPDGAPRDWVVAYPGGDRQEVQSVPSLELPADRAPAAAPLDLDGDGVPDRIEAGRSAGLPQGLVRVRSGATGSVLYEDHDEDLEYEADDRAFSLGDLDGDGYGELALVYPRMRRRYDTEHLLDHLFEGRSWIVVVSGSVLFGPGLPREER